jgi:hypothetical protein
VDKAVVEMVVRTMKIISHLVQVLQIEAVAVVALIEDLVLQVLVAVAVKV